MAHTQATMDTLFNNLKGIAQGGLNHYQLCHLQASNWD